MTIEVPEPFKQIWTYNRLVDARGSILHGALRDALVRADPIVVAEEMGKFAPEDARRILAAAGVRDEHVFAVPEVLRQRPSVIGYYRLLLGVSMKQFYSTALGTQMFMRSEEAGTLSPQAETALPLLCEHLNESLAQLVVHIGNRLSDTDIEQLPLLTLGAQFDGSFRNVIGQNATRAVYHSIKEVIEWSGIPYYEPDENTVTFTNSAGREIMVQLASDPDVVVKETLSAKTEIMKVAIEIKGGLDRSNVYNRAGEAEKSHQKVRTVAKDFWTCISLKGTNREALTRQAPTTTKWFDVSEVIAQSGPSWDDFCEELSAALGIPLGAAPPDAHEGSQTPS